jgi:hypothetical protein
MQRKQQVGECWVCVILFAQVVVSVFHQVRGGGGGGIPPCRDSGENAQIFFPRFKCVTFLGGFLTHGFYQWFSIFG